MLKDITDSLITKYDVYNAIQRKLEALTPDEFRNRMLIERTIRQCVPEKFVSEIYWTAVTGEPVVKLTDLTEPCY